MTPRHAAAALRHATDAIIAVYRYYASMLLLR